MVLARSKQSDEEYRVSTENSIDRLATLLEELGYLGVRAHSSDHIVDLAARKMKTFQKPDKFLLSMRLKINFVLLYDIQHMVNQMIELTESPMYYFTLGGLDAQYDIAELEGKKRFGEYVIDSGKMAKFLPVSWPELFDEVDHDKVFVMLMEYGEGRDFGENHGTIGDVFAQCSTIVGH